MEIIVALDSQDRNRLNFLLKELNEFKPFYKIGLELFYTFPNIVEELKSEGFKVFLDLKLHDIPNTVESALKTLKRFQPDLINIHTLGGNEMMTRAAAVFQDTQTKIIGVTQLTSSDEAMLQALGFKDSMEESVLRLSTLAKASGLHGVVCSAQEVPGLKEHLGKNFLTVTPGIRLDHQNLHDQKRVVTPMQAKKLGSDFIVVGRPITADENPKKIYEKIAKDIL
jgi:orotidine-5'-phosphate decarboxylase